MTRAMIVLLATMAMMTPALSAQTSRSLRSTVIVDAPDYRMSLGPDARVVNIVLPAAEYDAIRQRPLIGRDAASSLSHLVYEHFGDVFDFIIFAFDARQPWTAGDTISGINMRTRVLADGLGIGPRGVTDPAFGSARLASVTFLRSPAEISSGLTLHELVHTWGQSLIATDKPSHWGRSSVGGQLGGWRERLERHMYGVFAPRGNRTDWRPLQWQAEPDMRRDYAPLELYMMGLLSPDSVPPIEMALGARSVSGGGAAFTAARLDTITMAHIIATHGPRSPSWRDSQRAFRGIVVVLSSTPVAVRQMVGWESSVAAFEDTTMRRRRRVPSFAEATGGRATIQLGNLDEAIRPLSLGDARREAAARCATLLPDSLAALQRTVLALVPATQPFPNSESPGGVLSGHMLAHGYAIVRGMGLTLYNPRAAHPMPQTLYYMPADTSTKRDWSDFFSSDGPYRLVGWGYSIREQPRISPPDIACIPRDAWFTREAGWHLRTGTIELTPGMATSPPRPPGRNHYFWRPRALELNVWLTDGDVPFVSPRNPRGPERGVELPAALFGRRPGRS